MDQHRQREERGTPIDPEIADYYDRAPEETRLDSGAFLLEALRTKELIARHAPPPPAKVADVGGGAGPYALWLAGAGYEVHLRDASPRLVDEARRRSAAAASSATTTITASTAAHRPLASCEVGDARSLDFADASLDIVLLLGPLYHLTEANDRARALAEALRVLKPGGWLFAAAISRYASTLDGLGRDLFGDPSFAAMANRDLRDGQHRNATRHIDYFTTAYFHRPEDLRAEVLDSGLQLEALYGIEGPGWLLPDIDARLADDATPTGRRAVLLDVARKLESEPSLLGISAHLLAVARKAV